MKKLLFIFFTSLIFVNIGCNTDFDELNINPNKSQVTDPNLLLSSSILRTQNIIYRTDIGGDAGLCWAQHWSKIDYNETEQYIVDRGLSTGVWNALYANVIAEAKDAAKLAEAEGNKNLQAAALVMQANAFQILTDLFGPVPFKEAAVEGNLQPAFDSQEEVYNGILGLLDQANALLANGTGTITPSADLLFAGNVTKWRKLANSLKLKALMRISKVRNVNAQVQALVNSGLLMSSNSDSAQLVYLTTNPDANPIFQTLVTASRTEYKLNSVLVGKLKDLNDPRLAVYAKPIANGQYVGNDPGKRDPGNIAGYSSVGTFYLNAKLPGVVLSYAQVKLFLAEAAAKGIISGGIAEARTHYNQAITANMQFNGVSNLDINSYLALPTTTFADVNQANEKIATQMWIALYGQGIEAWTEWRRTGFPALSPAFNQATVNTEIPKRFFYATNSVNFNQANYAAASATLNNGDSLYSKLWWMN